MGKTAQVIYENRSEIFEIWVAKKPDISGFFGHVINLVMTIWQGMTKLMTYEKTAILRQDYFHLQLCLSPAS
jgi:hypothetical protein